MIFGGTSLGCCAGERPLCLVRLLLMRCFFFSNFLFILVITSDLFLLLYFVVKESPKLESKFKKRVQAAIKYARTIDDFDELIDPRMIARHCLGPEPSLYVLNTLDRKERKRKLHLHRGSSYPLFLRHQNPVTLSLNPEI